jgi:serine/threonine-protein kinase
VDAEMNADADADADAEMDAEADEGEEARAAAAAEREQQAYNLYGECRFGFRQALRDWPENPDARDGLRRAVGAMVDFELAQHDPKAAALLLGELDPRPRDLAARVEAAAKQREHELARARDAERIAQQHDASVGQRTRWFLATALGLCWTALPALLARTGWMDNYTGLIVTPLANLAALLGLWLWARESMSKTAVNRAIGTGVALAFVMQLLADTGGLLLGLAAARTRVFQFVVWGTCAAMLAAAVDRRLWPTAVAFALGFLAACAWPSALPWWMSAADLVLTINVVVCWRVETDVRRWRRRRRRRGSTRSARSEQLS